MITQLPIEMLWKWHGYNNCDTEMNTVPPCGWFIYLPHFLWNDSSLYFCTQLIIWTTRSWRSLHCNSKLYAYLIFMSQIYLYFYPVTNNCSTYVLIMFEWNEDNSFLNSFWKLEVLFTTMGCHTQIFTWFHPETKKASYIF